MITERVLQRMTASPSWLPGGLPAVRLKFWFCDGDQAAADVAVNQAANFFWDLDAAIPWHTVTAPPPDGSDDDDDDYEEDDE